MPLNHLIRNLRIWLHSFVAVLIILGNALMFSENLHTRTTISAILLSLIFSIFYILGTISDSRLSNHIKIEKYSINNKFLWLVIILAIWLLLIYVSANFLWLLFPLTFIVLDVLQSEKKFSLSLLAVLSLWAVSVSIIYVFSNKQWGVAGILGSLVGTLVAIGIYNGYLLLKKQARYSEDLVISLTNAQEELKVREYREGKTRAQELFARDIHDSIIQGLISVNMLSRVARTQLDDKKYDSVNNIIKQISDTNNSLISEARRLVEQNSIYGQKQDLIESLQDISDRTRKEQAAIGSDLEIITKFSHIDISDIDPQIKIFILRATQSLLSNVIRHANATKVVLSLGMLEGVITLDIYDNGVGMVGDEGYGLKSLRAGLGELGGSLAIESGQGTGTIVALNIPVRSNNV